MGAVRSQRLWERVYKVSVACGSPLRWLCGRPPAGVPGLHSGRLWDHVHRRMKQWFSLLERCGMTSTQNFILLWIVWVAFQDREIIFINIVMEWISQNENFAPWAMMGAPNVKQGPLSPSDKGYGAASCIEQLSSWTRPQDGNWNNILCSFLITSIPLQGTYPWSPESPPVSHPADGACWVAMCTLQLHISGVRPACLRFEQDYQVTPYRSVTAREWRQHPEITA